MSNSNSLLLSVKKIWAVLLVEERRRAVSLFIFMLIAMLLETLGLSLILPVMAVLTQSDLSVQFPVVQPILQLLGNPSHTHLVLGGLLVLVTAYTVKVLFMVLLVWKQMSFVHNIQASLSQRLYVGYLRQPYVFHLQRNSAELIRNIITETNVFTRTGLNSAMTLLTEVLVLIGITALLIMLEPIGAFIVVTIFGGAGWVYHSFTADRIRGWGEARQYHEGLRIQHLQQGLGGVKDVKLLGREEDFFAQYKLHNFGSALVGKYYAVLQQLPRLWLELLAVIGLSALILTMVWQGKDMGAIIPTIGVFVAAAFRLMPSANRIINGIHNVRYTLAIINTLENELNLFNREEEKQSRKISRFEKVITLENVTFQYPSTEKLVLHNINLSIPIGTSVGFIGSSGAGKSTLVDIILGLLTPKDGFVRIDNIDIQSNLRSWQDQLGYVPQSIFLTDDTLRRNIAFGLSEQKINNDLVKSAIKDAQLEEFINSLPQGVETIVGERGIKLSGGQKQRIGIARALYHEPAILVLDEATSSLDTTTEEGVMQAVAKLRGKTIIVIAHRLSTVKNCDFIYRIDNGKIIDEGIPSSILDNEITETN